MANGMPTAGAPPKDMLQQSSKPSVLGGAGLGALRVLMSRNSSSENYLRDTLAGAILGALQANRGARPQIRLAARSIHDLQANPHAAMPALTSLQKGAPDQAMQEYASKAIADLIMGTAK